MPPEVGRSYEVSSDPDVSIWQPRLYQRSISDSGNQHPTQQEANVESLLANKRPNKCYVPNLFIWKAVSLLPEILKTTLFLSAHDAK